MSVASSIAAQNPRDILQDNADPKLVSDNMPCMEFRGVSKAYGSNHVLRELDLVVPARQRLALIGRSGSGKTTLLRLLMTIERPDAEIINIDGEPLGWHAVDGKVVWRDDVVGCDGYAEKSEWCFSISICFRT